MNDFELMSLLDCNKHPGKKKKNHLQIKCKTPSKQFFYFGRMTLQAVDSLMFHL